jgi:hypothetical protein
MDEVKSFDVDAWRSQGEQALASFDEKIAALTQQIDALKEERKNLAEALGKDVGGKVITRTKIRPLIVQVLSGKDEPLSFEGLFEEVVALNSTVTEDSFRRALARAVKAGDKLFESEEGYYIEED